MKVDHHYNQEILCAVSEGALFDSIGHCFSCDCASRNLECGSPLSRPNSVNASVSRLAGFSAFAALLPILNFRGVFDMLDS